MGFTERDPLAQLSLPPGFRFYPTDEELMVQYLCRKVAGHQFSLQIIADIDLYKFDPWVLPSKAMFGEKEWYFFSPRDRKYPNGSRPNRVAGSGYWKATGTDKIITTQGTRKVGIKKALVFYIGKAPKGTKTNWIMHEYRLSDPTRRNATSSSKLDDWVLCRIYKKRSPSSTKPATNTTFVPSPNRISISSSISYKDHSSGGYGGSSASSSSRIDNATESIQETYRRFSPDLPCGSSPKTNDQLGDLLRLGSGNFDWATLLGLTNGAAPPLPHQLATTNGFMTPHTQGGGGGGIGRQQAVHGNDDFALLSLPPLRQADEEVPQIQLAFELSASETITDMSYSIKVRVYQTNTNAFFRIVEKGVWHYANGGTWSDKDDVLTLTMGGSGTSGMLRFMTEQGKEGFFIALGVHNYKRWVDIVTGLANDVTCVKALPEYYNDTNPVRVQSREAQRTSQSITNIDHRTISCNYRVAEGNDLELDIVIG